MAERDGRGAPRRTWLITGAGRGLGLAFAEEAVRSGDVVVATARSLDRLAELRDSGGEAVLPLALDLTSRSEVADAVARAVAHFGSLDVLVNNAGYGLSGAVEELDEARLRRQMEVNFFAAVWCTQAALPYMRSQGAGHIFQVSSVGGIAAFPNVGGYNASKWALEAISESLAQEVASFGIRVTIVEPGPFRTDWNGASMDRAERIGAYDGVLDEQRAQHSGAHAFTQAGDPAKAARALRAVLESDRPPLRLLLGARAAELVPALYRRRLAEWAEWEPLARDADFAAAHSQDLPQPTKEGGP
jgi:NAD(P)-dependent dehydrogenase (short-subunit alcohol dehydrogenase family)